MNIPVRFLTLALFLLLAFPAAAEETHLRFKTSWGGFHAADFVIVVKEEKGRYRTELICETRGIVQTILQLRVDGFAEGTRPDSGPLAPDYYQNTYSARRTGRRTVGVTVDHKTGILNVTKDEQFSPGEPEKDLNPEIVEEVPVEDRTRVIDPLTVIPELARLTEIAAKGGAPHYRMKVYDGRRRYDWAVAYIGLQETSLGRKKVKAHRVRARMVPISGYKARHRKMWEDSFFDMWLSDDGKYLPVKLVNDSFFAATVVRQVKRCGPEDKDVCRVTENEDDQPKVE